MKLLKRYIKFHLRIIYNFYKIFLLRTDKRTFAFLFNLKSILIGSPVRLKWIRIKLHYNILIIVFKSFS